MLRFSKLRENSIENCLDGNKVGNEVRVESFDFVNENAGMDAPPLSTSASGKRSSNFQKEVAVVIDFD